VIFCRPIRPLARTADPARLVAAVIIAYNRYISIERTVLAVAIQVTGWRYASYQ
jgi:hypothetical protein